MLEFIAAVYNEQHQMDALIKPLIDHVDRMNFVDDGSTDLTRAYLHNWKIFYPDRVFFKTISHTGLPETVKADALEMCKPNSWVLMLDADERLADGVLDQIKNFISSPEADGITHVWFTLHEFIDEAYTGKSFFKCRLFKANAAHFSTSVHVSDWFDGNGRNFDWVVLHSKTKEKQVMREKEYIETYKRLISEGKMTEDQAEEVMRNHYFVRENIRSNSN